LIDHLACIIAVELSIRHIGLSPCRTIYFFFKDTATTEIYTLSLHDALPIFFRSFGSSSTSTSSASGMTATVAVEVRSEEHTSELQSLAYLVCRLLLDKNETNRGQDSEEHRERRHDTTHTRHSQQPHTTQPTTPPPYLIFFRHLFFFFNDTATTEIYTLSLHDALPI